MYYVMSFYCKLKTKTKTVIAKQSSKKKTKQQPKMGLLSDTPLLKNLQSLAVEKSRKVFFLLYFGSIIFSIILSHNYYSNPNYFSENALMAGIAKTSITHGIIHETDRLNKILAEIPKVDQKDNLIQTVKTHLQSNIKNLVIDQPDENSLIAVLPTKRASSEESFILHVPWSLYQEHIEELAPENTSYNSGLGLLLSLIEEYSQQNFWSKG